MVFTVYVPLQIKIITPGFDIMVLHLNLIKLIHLVDKVKVPMARSLTWQ